MLIMSIVEHYEHEMKVGALDATIETMAPSAESHF